jgi:hypothetical protein
VATTGLESLHHGHKKARTESVQGTRAGAFSMSLFIPLLELNQILNQGGGPHIANQDLARVSPLMHTQVIPYGTYRFSAEEEPKRMYAAAS